MSVFKNKKIRGFLFTIEMIIILPTFIFISMYFLKFLNIKKTTTKQSSVDIVIYQLFFNQNYTISNYEKFEKTKQISSLVENVKTLTQEEQKMKLIILKNGVCIFILKDNPNVFCFENEDAFNNYKNNNFSI